MTVTTSTCFLCHFKGQPLNEGLGACTHCHQIPTRKFDLGGGVMFTHDLAYEKGVDCANCHGDVVRGTGDVPRERCLSCHNRQGDLARASDHVFMHAKHVDRAQGGLRPVPHADRALAGAQQAGPCRGRLPILSPESPSPAARNASGAARSCSRRSPTAWRWSASSVARAIVFRRFRRAGRVIWRGSADMCLMCHSPATVKEFAAYHKKLRGSLPEIQAAVARLRAAIVSAKLPEKRRPARRGVGRRPAQPRFPSRRQRRAQHALRRKAQRRPGRSRLSPVSRVEGRRPAGLAAPAAGKREIESAEGRSHSWRARRTLAIRSHLRNLPTSHQATTNNSEPTSAETRSWNVIVKSPRPSWM